MIDIVLVSVLTLFHLYMLSAVKDKEKQ